MQTRFTSSIDARRCTTILALLSGFALLPSCKDEPTPVVESECRPNQFRRCDAECGRGVQQCVEPGVWGGCACTVLDAAIPDARPIPDASDGATDAPSETGDDGGAADAALEAETEDPDAADSDVPDSPSG